MLIKINTEPNDAIALYFNIPLMAGIMSAVLSFWGLNSGSVRSVAGVIFTIVSLGIITLYNRIKIKRNVLFVIGGWLILIILTAAFFNPPDYLIHGAIIDGISHVLIPIFIISQVTRIELLVQAFRKYIPLATIYCVLQFFLPPDRDAYFTFSYSVLLCALVLFAITILEGGKKNYILLGTVVISLLLLGTRSVILCFTIEFLIILYLNKSIGKRLYISLAIIVLMILSYFLGDIIVDMIIKLMPNSRSAMFLSGAVEDNTRSLIWNDLIRQVMENPLEIRGILSDRIAFSTFFGIDDINKIMGSYAHNFVVEILFQFGALGALVLLYFFYQVLRAFAFCRSRGNDVKLLFAVFTSLFFGKLTVASSYLLDFATGGIIGVLFIIHDEIHRLYATKYNN